MKTLFFRVLALLLGSFILVVIASYLLFGWINHEVNPGDRALHRYSLEVAERLAAAHENGSLEPARRRLHKRRRIRAWILDVNNRSLVNPPIPPPILAKIDSYPLVIRPYRHGHSRSFIFAHEIKRGDNEYRVILAADYQPFRRGGWSGWLFLSVFATLFGLIAASALLSYWMLRPLRSLRDTAGAISVENLSTRIPDKITKRKDAFGELGRELNSMTNRLALALKSQQQLLRDVSHELRSPLARIQVAASVSARKHGDNAELERIEQEVERLDDLIERLLSMSRLKTLTDLERELFDLSLLLREVVANANYEYQSDGCSAVLRADQALPLKANRLLISNALENIIRNALRFSPRNGLVSISAYEESASIHISIIDQGPGISPEHLQHIFEPFYRVDASRDTSEGHHGVGLALTKAIIDLHNGVISAVNGANGGLVIQLSLPKA